MTFNELKKYVHYDSTKQEYVLYDFSRLFEVGRYKTMDSVQEFLDFYKELATMKTKPAQAIVPETRYAG